MKLLCVTPWYWPAFQYGGPIFANHHLNQALVKKSVDVTVYTTSAGLHGRVNENRETYVDGVKVTYFSIVKGLDLLGATGWQFSCEMTTALRESVHRFDVVNINGVWTYPSAVAGFMCRKRGVPYVVTAHGTLYPYALSKKRWKKL